MEIKSSDEQALEFMKKDLPDYLQNILLACGYDRVSAIAKIDVSTDVDKMLQYIHENFEDLSM